MRIKYLTLKYLPDKILLWIKKIHYARFLRSISDRDERDFKIIRDLVKSGDFVVDIGANIGLYTKFLSDLVGNDGRVYSFEPVPISFEILISNVRKLDLKNVVPLNCAISDSSGLVTIEIPSYKNGGENFYQARIVSESKAVALRRVKIHSQTIDAILEEHKRKITFIKCDVEGHELNCIRGAEVIIKKYHPAWLIEISGDPDDPSSEAFRTFELLYREGYNVYWFDGTKLNHRRPLEKTLNYLFLRKEHLRSLTNWVNNGRVT